MSRGAWSYHRAGLDSDGADELPAELTAAYVYWSRVSTALHPDGSVTVREGPAVWTVAHRGHTGGGRLDLWCYITPDSAWLAAADFAMACGLGDDPDRGEAARAAYAEGRFQDVLDLYEAGDPDRLLLRVEPAWLQDSPEFATSITYPPGSPEAVEERSILT